MEEAVLPMLLSTMTTHLKLISSSSFGDVNDLKWVDEAADCSPQGPQFGDMGGWL